MNHIAQIFALLIFVGMFILIITEIIERHRATLLCGLATIIFVFGIGMHDVGAIKEALSLHSFTELGFWYQGTASGSTGINWETITFIAGMMVMVEGMAQCGFFRWLCLSLAKLVKYKTQSLLIVFMILAFVLSMFIDSITVIMFLAAASVELSQVLGISPIPFILSEIFCSNLGGSATMCGDPPNIIIGTALGYSFKDFLMNTGIISAVSLIFMIVYFHFCFANELKQKKVSARKFPNPKDAIISKKRFICSIIIFIIAVVLLVSHANTGLTVASIGVIIAFITTIVNYKYLKSLYSKIDFKTLLFFIGLFVVVSGIEQTGVLDILSNYIASICGNSKLILLIVIVIGSAIASAIIDNIPFAATMIPVIKTLSISVGIPLDTLAWALSMGTDIGGNATPIGASANVVGTSISARSGHRITWSRYCFVMVPATIMVLIISIIMIYFRY